MRVCDIKMVGFSGRKHTEETKEKIKNSYYHTHLKGRINLNEKNGNWVGNKVQTDSVHNWIRRRKPKPKFCEKCNEREPYELANISETYKRDINDFEWLCRSCHSKKHRGREWHEKMLKHRGILKN